MALWTNREKNSQQQEMYFVKMITFCNVAFS